MLSIDANDCEWFLWVHTTLQNNLFGIITNIYNVKENSGDIELPVLSKMAECCLFRKSTKINIMMIVLTYSILIVVLHVVR